jgi:ketosteroid isomerase-like protein
MWEEKMMKASLVAVLLALTTTPSVAQTTASEIERANQQFEQAFNGGDAAAVARLYGGRATILPPEAGVIEGREAIQKFWQGAIDAGLKNLTLKSTRVDEFGGEAAREIGLFSLEAPGPQGGASKIDGKYVVVWRKDGSQWQLDSDIWNMSKPPEPEIATGSSTAPVTTGSGTSSPSR